MVAEVDEYLEGLAKEFHGGCADYEFQRVCFEMLKRFALNINAINKLTESFIDNRGFKFPIFILLRTLLADTIIVHYLLDEVKSKIENDKVIYEQENFLSRYHNLTSASLNKVDNVLRDLLRDKVITLEERNNIVSGWANRYPNHFDDKGKLKKANSKSQVKSLLKEIATPDNSNVAGQSYLSYLHLSQYEHFSEVTEQLINNTTSTSDDVKRMMRCMEYILFSLRLILISLGKEESQLKDLHSLIHKLNE